jgi:membrane protease YdiL (CAAX protease family)
MSSPPTERRWRITRIAGSLARLLALAAALLAIDIGVVGGLKGAGAPLILVDLVTAAAAFAVYVGGVRLLERRRLTELSPRRAPSDLLLGVLIGAGFFTVIIGVVALLGSYHVDGTHPVGAIGDTIALGVLSGVFEELLFRGVLFRIIEKWMGTWRTLGLSAAIFGGGHLTNPNATVWSALAIALTAGVVLALTYVATRSLWVPIGFHIAWNATQSAIFGVPVSGYTRAGLLRAHLSGSHLISGGQFGVEGSLITAVTGVIAATALIIYVRRQGNAIRPSWRQVDPIAVRPATAS